MRHCTKTQKDLKLSEATYSKEETNWNNLQGPETTYIKQETTWSNLYQARNDLKQPTTSKKQPKWAEPTNNEQNKMQNNQQQVDFEIILQYEAIGSLL